MPMYTLYGAAHCCLCDRLEAMLRARGVAYSKCNIRDNLALRHDFADRIPVLVHEGRVIIEGRPSEDELDAALAPC